MQIKKTNKSVPAKGDKKKKAGKGERGIKKLYLKKEVDDSQVLKKDLKLSGRFVMKQLWDSSPGKLTIFVLDAALVCPIAARLRLELDVAELQHGCHQLQHRLHFILHKAHDLHGILGRGWIK